MDFSEITRDNPYSILFERFIIEDMAREQLVTVSLMSNSKQEYDNVISVSMPWLLKGTSAEVTSVEKALKDYETIMAEFHKDKEE